MVGSASLGLVRKRLAHRGPACPVPHNLYGLQLLVCPTHHLTRRSAGLLIFFIFMIKLSMFKIGKTFTKLNKDSGDFDDKLIIQHFHYIL